MKILSRGTCYFAVFLALFLSSSLVYDVAFTLLHDVLYYASFILPILLYAKYGNKREVLIEDRLIEVTEKPKWGKGFFTFDVKILLLFLPFLLFVSQLLALFSSVFFKPVPVPQEPFFILLLTSAILPAILEETLFRGVFTHMFSRISPAFGVFVSALLFALAHMNLYQFVYTFGCGILLAIAYQMTKSLLVPILLHFANNAIAIILNEINHPYVSAIYFCVILFLGAACFLLLLYKYKERFPKCDKKIGKEMFSVLKSPLGIMAGLALIYAILQEVLRSNLG